MKQGTDWLGWSLQFIAGLVVGGLVGLFFMAQHRRFSSSPWLFASQHVPVFISGAALLGASLASLFGDRLWLGESYRVIPPDGIQHTDTSRTISIAVGVLGRLLILTAILRQFGVF